MEFNYYYGTEADQFTFIRIPKLLLTAEIFSALSLQAKVLYGLLLDRMSLSAKNHWLDDDNRVYIIYQIAEIQEDLGYSKKKSMEFLSELEKIGLVEKRKRGFGLPSILYVKNFIADKMGTSRGVENDTSGGAPNEKVYSAEDDCADENIEEMNKNEELVVEEMSFQSKIVELVPRSTERDTSRSADMGTSRGAEIATTEVSVREPLNSNTKHSNNNGNNTESNLIRSTDETQTWHDYQKLVRDNLEITYMLQRYPYEQEMIYGICDLIVEVLLSKNSMIVIASDSYPADLVKSKLLKLDSSHLEYVLDRLASNTSKVRNIKKYLLAALFNAPSTISGYYQAEVNHDMPQFAKQN